jgi:3-oxoacyl-[acyl-carrier protein] reductase
MDLGLTDKGAIVTGASQGIGRAVAIRLAAEGARVLLLARSPDALRETAGRCGDRAAALVLDITREDAPELIAAAAAEHMPQVDILVNNAGMSGVRPLETLTAEDFRAHMDISVIVPLRLMQTFVPGMASRGDGAVVNVASIAGRRPSATNVAYSVSKAAELNLTRAFADHYAGRGVRINAVNPGPVASPLWVSARRAGRHEPTGGDGRSGGDDAAGPVRQLGRGRRRRGLPLLRPGVERGRSGLSLRWRRVLDDLGRPQVSAESRHGR